MYVPLHTLPSSNAIFAEFLICSEGPVESWSVDAPQTVEEGLRELAWIIRKPENRWDAYIPGANRVRVPGYFPWFSTHPENEAAGASVDSSFSLFSLVGDHNREFWTYETLVNKLNGIIQRWGNWNRRNGALPPAYVRSKGSAQPSVRKHFESSTETYFHENSIAVGDARFLRAAPPPTRWVEEDEERASTHF